MTKACSASGQSWLLVPVMMLLCLVAAPDRLLAQGESEAVLILDHSGSMWGQMEGSAKIGVMRDAIKAVSEDHVGKLDLGVLTYGTSKKNSCTTFETLKTVGPIEPDEDAKAIAKPKPASSAAIAGALPEAVKLFKTEEGLRTIILISDSTDDCKADPCAVAQQLKTESENLIAHVIAFSEGDMEPLKALSCIAENTGGTFQTANSPSELNDALRKVFELAEEGAQYPGDGSVPAGADGGDGQPGAPSVFLSDDPGTLVLSAIMSKAAAPLNSGLIWRIYSIEIQDDGSYKLLHRINDAQIAVTLPPGDYLINVAYGQAHVTKRLTVWPGKRLEDVFNLKAGGLRLYATLAKKPLLAENALSFDVYSEETDQSGNRRRVIAKAKSGVVLRLNSGTYRVVSKFGDANSVMDVDVTIEPGKLTEATIDHQAGKVTFRLVERQGGEALADTIWHIYSSDGQLVRKSGGAFPSHVLAAGDYKVRVKHGDSEFDARFSVHVGDKSQVEVIKP